MTLESSEQGFDARCAMELGAAASTIGRVSPDRLRALRGVMSETLSLLADGRIVDIDVYARRNQEFHNAIIDLADNPVLSDAYRHLGAGGLTTSLLRAGSEVGQDVADDHRAIVEAYEEANLDAALAVSTPNDSPTLYATDRDTSSADSTTAKLFGDGHHRDARRLRLRRNGHPP